MTGQPAGLLCLGCGQPPYAVLGGGTQAFCGTPDCRVVTWDPTMTVDEMLEDISYIDLSGWAG